MVAFNSVQFRMYENLKSDDATFLEKLTLPECRAVQEHFISTLLGESKFSVALKREANRSEEIARQAVAQLCSKLEEYKKLSVATAARESVLHKQAIDLSMEILNLRKAATFSESRCEARLRSLRDELEGQQETLKSVLVGMVKQLGLEDRAAGNVPPMHTHRAPEPRAPPAVVSPTEAVAEEDNEEWILDSVLKEGSTPCRK